MNAIPLSPLTNPESILVTTNLGDLHRIMPFALQMAGKTGARLELLHILQFSDEFDRNLAGLPYSARSGALNCAKNMLEPWRMRAEKMAIRCSAIVLDNRPAATGILEEVHRRQPDRVLIGSRSKARMGKLLLGPVVDQVLRSINVPVFTIGPEAEVAPGNGEQELTLLFAADLRSNYEVTAALVAQLSSIENRRTVMMHVLPYLFENQSATQSNLLSAKSLYDLHQLARKLEDETGAKIEAKLAHGNPAVEILAESAATKADLIVMGASNRSPLDNVERDCTMRRVLAHAHCPVLILKSAYAETLREHTAAATAA